MRLVTRSTGPALGDWVTLHAEPTRGGRLHCLAVNHRDGNAARLSATEHDALRRGAFAEIDPGLVADLRAGGYLTRRPAHLDRPDDSPRWRRLLRALVRQEVTTRRADGVVRSIHRLVRPILAGRAAFAGQAVLAVTGLVAVAWLLVAGPSFEFASRPWQVPFVLVLSLAVITIHELGHALVLVHHGRSVHAVGFKLHLGTPAFFVDSVDGLLLSRRQRLAQAAAGPWAEWLATAVVALAAVAATPTPFGPLLTRFAVLNGIGILSNLLPFVGLDGHWLISDALREPDLADRSKRALRAVTGRRPLDDTSRAATWALAAYAVANALVATVLAGMAVVFWYALFGGVAAELATGGVVGRSVLVVAGLLLALPTLARAARPAGTAIALATELAGSLRFRLERRWRVRAIGRLRTMPSLGDHDEAGLGVLAGRLHRVRLEAGHPIGLAHAAVVLVERGSLVVDSTAHPVGALLHVDPGTTLAVGRRGTRIVVLDGAAAARSSRDAVAQRSVSA